MSTVLAILGDGFEEIETLAPIDILRRAGLELSTASLNRDIHVTGRSGVVLHADTLLDQVPAAACFDCLLIPGGPGVGAMRKDPRVLERIHTHAKANKWIAAICAAPLLLSDAGLLKGRKFTCYPSVVNELPESLQDRRVVIDGNLVTSRGAGTSLDFALSLVEVLCSAEKAQDVRTAICF